MIGTMVYLAALGAPQIAEAVGDASGSLVESFGRRLAVGVCDEVSARLKPAGGSLKSTFFGALDGVSETLTGSLKESIQTGFGNIIKAENVTLVSVEELALLRELAAAAATGADVQAAVAKLKAFHGPVKA